MERIFITGANRGLGLEFVRQFSERGDRVFATCRDPQNAGDLHQLQSKFPEQVSILELDVRDEDAIEAVRDKVAAEVPGIDLLINNAGVLYKGEKPANLDMEKLLNGFHINAIAPMFVTKHFLDLLREGNNPRIMNISSMLGSIKLKSSGGNYSYDGSKAALNMLTRALAFDLKPDGIIVVTVHPGWVLTDMGGRHAALKPVESIRGLLELADNLEMGDTSRFFRWDGSEHPW